MRGVGERGGEGGGRGAVAGLVKNYSEQHRSRRLHTQLREPDRGERRRLRASSQICGNNKSFFQQNKQR